MWRARITLIDDEYKLIELSADDIYKLLDMAEGIIVADNLKEIHIYKGD